jgi:[acyl-carrier-protein] S-malonyltransferase
MVTSVAAWTVLRKQGGFSFSDFAFAAGHSLGEYSALAVVETFTLADTARLLRTRGDAMQKAVPVGVGAMAALLGADLEPVLDICLEVQKDQIVTVANDNSVGQIVISGHREAVDRAIALAAERGIKKAIMLPVSAPFHCPLMAPAAEVMADALARVDMRVPQVPIIANVTADVVADPQKIRTLLVEQVTGMVRWRPTVERLAVKGVTEMLELGPGKTLAGLAKRIAPDVVVHSLSTPHDIDTYLSSQQRKAS